MQHSIFPGRYENLEKICDLVSDQATKAGFDDSAVYAIQTAVDEACSNIIEHAYQGEDRGSIEVTIMFDNDCLTIRLIDQGIPFDPTNITEPDVNASLKERDNHGLGLFFMQKLMDAVSFEFSEDNGNVLTMVKCLHPHP
jgi:serine/threonine-protein kinase RsbW